VLDGLIAGEAGICSALDELVFGVGEVIDMEVLRHTYVVVVQVLSVVSAECYQESHDAPSIRRQFSKVTVN
jgi:hypothetical protein